MNPTKPTVVDLEQVWDPDRGYSSRITYAGYETDLLNLCDSWVKNGYKAVMQRSGGKIQLVAFVPDKGEPFYDRWNLTSEVINQSIWELPSTAAILNATTSLAISYSRAIIRVALAQLTPSTAVIVGSKIVGGTSADRVMSAGEARIYNQILRAGNEDAEVRRPILQRNRTLLVSSADAMQISGKADLYTTGKLIEAFAIPNDVKNQITNVDKDALPPLDDMAWTWKLREDEREMIVGTGKAIERRCWVYGCWSKITNNFIA